MTRRIEILGFPDCQLLDVAGPLQVFSTVNDLARSEGAKEPYAPVVVGNGNSVRTSAGLSLSVEPMGPPNQPVDTFIIAGGVGVNSACEDAELVTWLRDRTRSARRTASVCSGAFLLATAGLLDGRRAVTHWQRCEEFSRRFPKVRLEMDPIFVRDGDIWTSAGVTAGIDLALAMVEADLGRDMALSAGRQLVVFLKRPGGQSQFSTALTLQGGAGRFDELHSWMQQNLQHRLSIDDLAARAGMSVRSFSRHYRRATGRTPASALEDMRLETARRLLEQNGPVSRVARYCGFGTEETMRRVFRRRLGASPQAYRERFV
ncbi:GlxA family transcriptional regulator [Nisaea sp.]|uniref:GlxA family transcriptional regulator n=1 Tax=Nisaea sp. TaxID=2024842 RepID=UPI002B279C47|nr:GlxA family transcriptional regulator [Nisaea sp.]